MVGTVDTTTQTKSKFIFSLRYNTGPCGGTVIDEREYTSTVSSRRRLTDTRVRPTDLLASMTGQPLVYRYSVTPGLQRKEYTGVHSCNVPPMTVFPVYGYDQRIQNSWGSYNDPPLPAWQNKVRERIGKQTINLAASCAEYRETGNMFLDLAKGARDAWNDMRHLRFGKYLKPKTWAKMQLQYKFGVQPLVNDVVTSAIRLNAHLGFPPRGVIHTSDSDTGKYFLESPYGGSKVVMSVRVARACIVYQNQVGRQFVHAGTPLEWAWELIPFSFVVDWGIQVGSWLQSLDALRGVNILGGTVSDKITRRGVADWISYPGYHCVRPTLYTYDSHSRVTTSTIPMARLTYEPSLTLEKVRTGLQLLTSAKTASPSNWWRPFH